MCVWQSHAAAGTSKFTGVAGCEALAKPKWVLVSVPAATAATMKSRLVIIVFLPGLDSRCSCAYIRYARRGINAIQCLTGATERRRERASLQLWPSRQSAELLRVIQITLTVPAGQKRQSMHNWFWR